MTRAKLVTILGVIAAVVGGLDTATVFTLFPPAIGAIVMASGSLAAAVGQSLGKPWHGGVTIIGAVVAGLGALQAADLATIFGSGSQRIGLVLAALGTIAAAIGRGIGQSTDS